MAAHIALHEVGVAFDAKPVSLASKATHTPEFLAVNPAGLIPVLLIDGRPLTEVAGILFYLARRFPEARLLPVNDPEAEAQVVSMMSFVASALHPSLGLYNLASSDDARAAALQRLWRVFRVAEQRLGTGEWAVGEYSIADIHLFRLYFRLRHTFHPKTDELPRLAAHYDRMRARPAVQRTLEHEAAIGYEIKNFTPPTLHT